MNLVEQEANHGEREAPVPHHPSYPCNKRGGIKIEAAWWGRFKAWCWSILSCCWAWTIVVIYIGQNCIDLPIRTLHDRLFSPDPISPRLWALNRGPWNPWCVIWINCPLFVIMYWRLVICSADNWAGWLKERKGGFSLKEADSSHDSIMLRAEKAGGKSMSLYLSFTLSPLHELVQLH